MNKKIISTIIGFIFLNFGTASLLHGQPIFNLLKSMQFGEKREAEVLKTIKTLDTNEINTISGVRTPLTVAAHNGDDFINVFKYLLDKSTKETINYNSDDKDDHSALYIACYGAAKEKVSLLLDKGAKAEQKCIDMVKYEIDRIENKKRPEREIGELEAYKNILRNLRDKRDSK